MRAVPLLLMLALVTAGCVSGSDDTTTTQSGTGDASGTPAGTPVGSDGSDDAPATHTEETGGVEGTVTDEELMPLANVSVYLVSDEAEFRATTGPPGAFSFSNVVPGTYKVFFERLGFQSLAKQTEVAVGQVTTIDAALAPVPVIEPYVEPLIFHGQITAGQAFLDIITGSLGLPGCDVCQFRFDLNETEAIDSVMFEPLFTPTVSNPTDANQLGYQIWSSEKLSGGDLSETAYRAGEWSSRAQVVIDGSELPQGSSETIDLVNYCEVDFVCVDQSFEIHVSIFYNGPPEEGYTALPPE